MLGQALFFLSGISFFVYKDLFKGPRTRKSLSLFALDILGTSFVSYAGHDMYKKKFIDPTRKEVVDKYIPILMRMKKEELAIYESKMPEWYSEVT